MISPHQVQVAFGILNHMQIAEFGPITPEWSREHNGRKLTTTEDRAKDAALSVLTEFLNSDDSQPSARTVPSNQLPSAAQPPAGPCPPGETTSPQQPTAPMKEKS